MKTAVAQLADRMLARIVPRVEADAGCSYVWYSCGCSGGLKRRKKCISGCSQIPSHCYPCEVWGTC